MLEDERSISAPSDLGSLFILKPKVWRYWLLGVLAYTFAICLENVIIFPSLWPRLLMFCDQYDSDDLRYYLGVILAAFSATFDFCNFIKFMRAYKAKYENCWVIVFSYR